MAYLGNDLQVAFPVYRNIDDISGSFNSSTTSFPLRVSGVAPVPAPLYSQQCLISVGGVVQRPDDSGSEGFRLSGGNIIFASAPTTGADFFGVILAGADYINAGGNFPSGTAAVPSITFNDDLDTGIYNSGINQVSITTGGSERLRIDSAGQIESVSLGTAAAPAFSFTTDPNTGIYSPGADQVAISTGGSGKLFVDASGNVGVSATPTALGTSVRTLEIKGAATNRSGGLSLTSSDNSANAFFYTFDNVSYLGTTATPLSFFTNNTERLRITSAGLVGIGTSSPGDVLHVKGSSTYAGVIADNSAATGGGAFRAYRNGVQKAVFCVDSWVTGTSSDDAAIYADAGGGIKFYTNNSSTAKAVLTSGGSLGIGTTSPGQALHVIGNIQVGDSGNERGIYVGAAGFSGAFLYRPTGDVQLSPRSGYGITFAPAPGSATEWGRWDSSGRLLVGTSTARSNFFNSTETADFQVESTNGLASIIRNTNATGGPGLILGKTRSTSVGGTTIVQSGDLIGAVSFQGSDGSEFVAAASVEAYVDGTPGANDMPGRLVFSTTADGASSPTERMRIKANGTTCIGTTTEGTMSGDAVVAIGPNIGIISKRASVAASGTVDININTGGGGYQGFLIVANTNNSNAAIRTHTTFSVFGRGTDSSIQQIATDNGTTSGASFTVTTPSNGVIRVTNTTAATTDVDIQFFGGTSG